MRKLTEKTKFKYNEDGSATIFAKSKESGKFEPFAVCHSKVISQIKIDGINKCLHLMTLPK